MGALVVVALVVGAPGVGRADAASTVAERRRSSGATCDVSVPATCTLGELGSRVGVRIGGTLDPEEISDPRYVETLTSEHTSLTPSNALKWYSVQSARGVFTFAGADAVVEVAQTNEMEIRGHTLVWAQDRFTPSWVTAIDDPGELRAELRNHVTTVMERYRGRIHRWDVVNEPLQSLVDGPGVTMSDGVFRRVLGERWLDEIFTLAHEVDPAAELWLNEYGVDWAPGRHDAFLSVVSGLVARGVPIHGIGLQTHRLTTDGPDPAAFASQIEDYAALGLRVALTEVDVPIPPDDPGALVAQAGSFDRIVAACLAVPACEEVTMWGVTDARTWLDELDDFAFLPKPTRPLLFDEQFEPKPAYHAVAARLAAGRPVAVAPPGPAPPPVSPAAPAPAAPAAPISGPASFTG